MKIEGAKTRCDVCARVADEKKAEAKEFKGFYIGPSINMATGKPDGKFPGIARANKPDEPVQLHACPGCRPKIKAMRSGADIAILPDGPLKKALREIVTGSKLRLLH